MTRMRYEGAGYTQNFRDRFKNEYTIT